MKGVTSDRLAGCDAVPAGSKITLPDDAEARTPFHVVDIPGESTVDIPMSENPVQISMPPYCCLTFPNKVRRRAETRWCTVYACVTGCNHQMAWWLLGRCV